MTHRAFIAAIILLTGTQVRADEQRSAVLATKALRPVTSQSLRAVPSSGIYEPSWSDNVEDPGILQVAHSVPTTGSADIDSDSSTTVAVKPFFELTQSSEAPSSPESTFAPSDTNELFSRLAVWTVIVLCLCVLTVLALRRWQRRQGMLPSGRGNARIIETLALGPGRAVSLVQLGQHQAFVGTDSGGISTIVLAPPAFGDEFDDVESSVSTDHSQSRSADASVVRTLGFPGTFTS